MATYCVIGYLDIFVKPSPDGWGLPTTIISWINTDKKLSDSQIYDKIQNSELDAVIKALSLDDVKKIMTWMKAEGMVGQAETQEITYTTQSE